jgi:hypothetical protein
MNLFDILLSKKEIKTRKSEEQPSMTVEEEPEISDVQPSESLRIELYKLLSKQITDHESLAKMVNEAELKVIKMRYRKLVEENRELSKRPTLSDYNYKDMQVQQLTTRLDNVKEATVPKGTYEQLEKETVHLKQELHRMNTKVDDLENIVSDYEELNSSLQWQLEQSEAKMLDSKLYDELEENYNALQTAHDVFQVEYLEQLQQNKLLQVQLQQLQEQLEEVQQSLGDTVTNSTLETDDLQPEVDDISDEDMPIEDLIDDLATQIGQDEEATVLEEEEEIPVVKIDFVEEEAERLVFDEVILEEASDESIVLVEQDVDEVQMEQAISDVLLKTVPTIEQGVTFGFPAYNPSSSFLLVMTSLSMPI